MLQIHKWFPMLRAKTILHLVSMPHREQLFSKFIFFVDTNYAFILK